MNTLFFFFFFFLYNIKETLTYLVEGKSMYISNRQKFLLNISVYEYIGVQQLKSWDEDTISNLKLSL